MADRSMSSQSPAGAAESADASGRKPWSAPHMRALKTSAAENGPNFPTADGIEGQS